MADKPTIPKIKHLKQKRPPQHRTIRTEKNYFERVEGNVYSGDTYYKSETYESKEPDFYEPILEQYQPPEYISTLQTPELVDRICERRFLILGGADEYDKIGLARHLAWQLQQKINTLKAKQWLPSSEPLNLVAHLHKHDDVSVFILDTISPQKIHYEHTVLQEIQTTEHYVIITTNNPRERWKLRGDESALFWQPDPSELLYAERDLTKQLCSKLNKAKASLPEQLSTADFASKPHICNVSLKAIAKRLRLPENIERFVQLLCSETEALDRSKLLSLIHESIKSTRTIWLWYHRILSPREKLLAIGLSLFNGLFDDQFFAAMEQVVEHAWRKRDPSLQALDYCDLEDLMNFYHLVPVENGTSKKIDSCFPGQRRALLKAAWDSHRRQILSAIPILEELIRNSVAFRSFNWELYGTEKRRERLRRVIAETLSDLGVITLEVNRTIENSLLEGTFFRLAADENIEVQAVVAQTMALWRNFGYEEELFKVLARWYQIPPALEEFIRSLVQDSEGGHNVSPQDYVRATMALVVGFASLYDLPNHFHKRLCNFMKDLAFDESEFVIDRFSRYTLPIVVRYHLAQLREEELLSDMIGNLLLNYPIGMSLASAYTVIPEEVQKTLDLWQNRCPEESPKRSNEEAITYRDAVLATIAICYGLIEIDTPGTLTVRDVLTKLKEILAKEKHWYIRLEAIKAILRQTTTHDFKEVENELQEVLTNISGDEYDRVIQALTRIYLEQRENLKDGDITRKINGRIYEIYIDKKRPLTPIEKAMRTWIKSKNTKHIVKQIAFRALLSFVNALDQKEQKIIETQKVVGPPPKSEKNSKPGKKGKKRKYHLSLRGIIAWCNITIISLLAIQTHFKYRSIIWGLLPEAFKQNSGNPEDVNFVLEKWHDDSEDREIHTISDILKRALSLSRVKVLLVCISLIGLVLLGIILFMIIW